ncbi:MAG: aspartyl protease family protein [Chloroflexi bacterium]|nr:aspartyl protease family protein [Chloroflexota bacterium]
MGVTQVDGLVRGPSGEAVSVSFLVDSGARYTLLPHDVWVRIGLEPTRTERFALADGSVIRRQMSECHVEFPWGAGHTPVILGEPGDEVALLGAITLEEFGLVLDPLRRSLRKARMLLLRVV